jgi:hypothetical protein
MNGGAWTMSGRRRRVDDPVHSVVDRCGRRIDPIRIPYRREDAQPSQI